MNWRTECNKKSNTHCLRFLFDIGDSLHLGFPCLFLPPLTFHRVFSFNKSNLPLHNWTFNYIKIFLIPNESNFFFFFLFNNLKCWLLLSPESPCGTPHAHCHSPQRLHWICILSCLLHQTKNSWRMVTLPFFLVFLLLAKCLLNDWIIFERL